MAKILFEVEGLLDVQEALGELQIGYATLYRWIKKGLVSPVKINGQNYFTKSDVDRLNRQRRASQVKGEVQKEASQDV